ncbi:hypothetical protein [Acanthopleuribacter pedis]|uniref:Uncharacterized protein n=1 Tax=Acanthopleuribacter pedis TaxID=442870 RepID=A0A8J7U5N3_9BACT|nr:hypothetical protein [Acanthopleuribacter pedis]MBO1322743.1 hypothetical protein [Acanthopleuribacter pedis]
MLGLPAGLGMVIALLLRGFELFALLLLAAMFHLRNGLRRLLTGNAPI